MSPGNEETFGTVASLSELVRETVLIHLVPCGTRSNNENIGNIS